MTDRSTSEVDRSTRTSTRIGDSEVPARSTDRRPRLQMTLIVFGAAGVLIIGLLASALVDRTGPWAGTVLPEAQRKPDVTLTDTSGSPYDLLARTDGRFTVLMFGYTSCPDVCPINLGTLDAAMEELGPEVRGEVDVVFVTVDPQVDTPEVLRTFLDRFDTSFVGLTGTTEQLEQAQVEAKVPIAAEGTAASTGSSGRIGHATQMIVYAPNGDARIVYPFGTRQSDWTRDLPRLLAGDEPTE